MMLVKCFFSKHAMLLFTRSQVAEYNGSMDLLLLNLFTMFLPMQSALCAYYDIVNSSDPHASMQLVEDVTIRDGELITPSTSFLKTWRIKNDGMECAQNP